MLLAIFLFRLKQHRNIRHKKKNPIGNTYGAYLLFALHCAQTVYQVFQESIKGKESAAFELL